MDNSVSPTTGQGTTYCDPQFTPAGCSLWGGGGITNASTGVAGLTEVTVARNSTTYHGGGIENLGRLFLKQTTIAENKAPAGQGGGLWNSATTGVSPTHTLIAENTGNDCANLGAIGSTATTSRATAPCGFTQPTDHTGGASFEPGLPGAPLYYAISSTSAAEDTGGEGENNCSGTDVRGVTRPQDSDGDSIVECDIGSYEKEAPGAAQAVALSVSSAKAAEGAVASAAALRPPGAVKRGAGALRFTVSLSHAAKKVVTVRAATADRTARAGADYRKKSAKLRFAPGQTKKSFKVRAGHPRRAHRDAQGQAVDRHQREDRPRPGHRQDPHAETTLTSPHTSTRPSVSRRNTGPDRRLPSDVPAHVPASAGAATAARRGRAPPARARRGRPASRARAG